MWEAVISGLTLGVILALSVGPVIFTIIKQSLHSGYAGGLSFVLGVWLSDILLVLVSNLFSELVRTLLSYKTAIGILGSLFLLGIGILYVFFKKVTLPSETAGSLYKVPHWEMLKIFTSGFLINTLNPSVIIFWLGSATAFSGQFKWPERTLVFSICILVNIVADILKVVMAGKLRTKLTLRTIVVINKISGTLLILFGLALFYGTFYLN